MTLPSMTRAEIQERAHEKHKLLLNFLAGGEVWTTVEVAAILLRCSRQSALRTLQSMQHQGLVKFDAIDRGLKLWGVTNHGIGLAGHPSPSLREFEVGKTNHRYITHHVQTQLTRLNAELAGWRDWTPDKILYSPGNNHRLKKIPDALTTRPDGKRIAVEIELFIKSKKRLAEIVAAYLIQIKDGHHDLVCYVTPHPDALRRALAALDEIRIAETTVKLTPAHRERFLVFDIDKFPNL